MAHCKDTSGVDAEHALDGCDKFFHIDGIPLLAVPNSRSSHAVVRVRLETCRTARTLHVDSDSERIDACIVQLGLCLNSFGRGTIAMECENDGRCLVDVVISRDVYEETSWHSIRRGHVKSCARSIGSQVCRQRHSTSSACSGHRDSVV